MIIKALSIKQPWAGLVLASDKRVENRTWSSDYVGPLLIHAGKTVDDRIPEVIYEYSGLYKMEVETMPEFKTGAVVGIAWKGKCHRHGSGPAPTIWHDPGVVWWPLDHVATFREPFAARGSQGLFEVDIPAETPLMRRLPERPGSIGEWIRIMEHAGHCQEPIPNLVPADAYLVAKMILAKIEKTKPDWGKEDFLSACEEAFEMIAKASKNGGGNI